MLKSLSIQNFKNLKNLRLEALGGLNLITGKNNTGKSTLLEALVIYASHGSTNVLFDLLAVRGEITENRSLRDNINVFDAISSLFPNRKVDFAIESSIVIEGEENEGNRPEDLGEKVVIRLVRYFEEDVDPEYGFSKRIIVDNPSKVEGLEIGLEITSNGKETIYPLSRIGRKRHLNIAPFSFQWIDSKSNTSSSNARLFDAIALTEKEAYLLDALRIIEPRTVRVAFINNGLNERKPIIKFENSNQVFPLQSMGDGMNRILSIILAMANAENGFLLIDEFENGLHFSVQRSLWEIIFHMSSKLNIQVFATTHSEDCIRSFEAVLSESVYSSDGRIIRLENRGGNISSVEFNSDELKIVAESEIEIR